jgi:glycosyltransferase involved in cell wall biosynthesis
VMPFPKVSSKHSSSRYNTVFFFRTEDSSVVGSPLWYEESELKRQAFRPLRKWLPRWFPHPHTPEFAAKRLRSELKRLRPDIINVHNLHAAAPWGWGPHLIEVCLEFAPVVWTLHDMWSFTGRCAYNYDCEKFITGCDASCPTPTEAPPLAPEKIAAAWEERRAIYTRHHDDLVIVTPSRWLANQARRGLFAQHRIEVIPYGFQWHGEWWGFFPYTRRPREDARRELGIEAAGPVLLLAAFDLTERRKGAEILPRLWQHIEHRPLTILTMGHGTITIDDPLIEVHSLGWIDDDRQKGLAYAAADALLHPAPVDNFPNVVLEAMACGTPTIALPIGGLPEMVRPGISGWLAEEATPAALGQSVDRAIRDLSLGKNMRESCRDLAATEYSLELQGARYFQLFQELRRG